MAATITQILHDDDQLEVPSPKSFQFDQPAGSIRWGLARGPILVVGDNAERRREFSVLMPDAELLEAGDRAAALMLLQRRDPPVALIDLGLSADPVMGSEDWP